MSTKDIFHSASVMSDIVLTRDLQHTLGHPCPTPVSPSLHLMWDRMSSTTAMESVSCLSRTVLASCSIILCSSALSAIVSMLSARNSVHCGQS